MDYLCEMYRWTIIHLEKRSSPEIVRATSFEFCFTVPAIWPDKAKNSTMAAAQAAGLGRRPNDEIFMIPEPEVAGIAH